MTTPKILFLDIESAPHLADVWSLFNVNVGLPQLRHPGYMLSVCGKFKGQKPRFWSVYHNDHDEMLDGIHKMMSESDVVVHYNGLAYDIPHLNREFLLGGFPPPAPSRQVDLYRVVKARFKFASNKLAFVSQALGLEGKISHEGHSLWTKCLNGDRSAWRMMKKYNIQDVILLEEMYDKLSPWIWNGPNAQLYGAGDHCCPACGGEDLRREGYAILSAGRYQRWQCRSCNAWSRSSTRESGVRLQGVNPR